MCSFYSPFHPFPSKKVVITGFGQRERERSAGVCGDMRTSGNAFEDPVVSVIIVWHVQSLQFLN